MIDKKKLLERLKDIMGTMGIGKIVGKITVLERKKCFTAKKGIKRK